MIRTIGLLELNSIAKGMEVTDCMLKTSAVTLIRANSICPGKYMVLISGDVSSVKASMDSGLEVGKEFVVDQLMLPSVHPQLIKAINGTTEIDKLNALGVLEFFSIATSIVAADAAVKAASVDLMDIRLGLAIGGKGVVTLTGDVSAVKEAVEVGARVAENTGMLLNKIVIPSPSKELFDQLL